MPFDNSNFPLVWMNHDEDPHHDHDKDLKTFEENLQHGDPFVILTDNAPNEDHEHSQEEKKRTILWMKKHKTELRTLVRAMIVIEPSAAKRMAFKPFGVAFGKIWGFPLKITSSHEEAMELAEKLLSEGATAVTA